jgi:glucuronosyltransferase
MHDQIDNPMDRAIYWIEYVIRHQGAPHLRNASRDLFLLQRGLVDVFLVILAACLLMAYGAVHLCAAVWHSRYGSKKLAVDLNKKGE